MKNILRNILKLGVILLLIPAWGKSKSKPAPASEPCVVSGAGSIVCNGRMLSPTDTLPIMQTSPNPVPVVPVVPVIRRDARGRIARSSDQRRSFMQQNPCPATGKSYGSCPGWIIDHINPLACGGADNPSNMQWQDKVSARAKDKWERKYCGGQ